MKIILTLAVFLGFMLPSFCGFASDLDNKLFFFLAGGQSIPVGDFSEEVKTAFNWGVGVEYRFLSNWAIGAYINKADFKHKNTWYDSWNLSWTYRDWTFIRANLWGKYIFFRKNFTPFLKLGIGSYFIENKITFIGESELKRKDSRLSLVPGVGFEYKIKRFIFYLETDYNIMMTKTVGGDRLYINRKEFLNILLGVGFCLLEQ